MALRRVCACFGSIPAFRRAIADHTRLSRGSSVRLTALVTQTWVCSGYSKPGGITPMIVRGNELIWTCFPTMAGSDPKRRFHKPWLMIATVCGHPLSSSGTNVRPRTGWTPSTEKNPVVTPARGTRSGSAPSAPKLAVPVQ